MRTANSSGSMRLPGDTRRTGVARYLPARRWRYLHEFAGDSGGDLRFLDPAEEEMLEAARSYEDQTVGLGERFLDEVEGCVDLLPRPPTGIDH